MKKKNGFWKGFSSLVCTAGGAGTGYMAAQCGTLAYMLGRELMNLALGKPLASIPEMVRDYALYTSVAAFIGEVGGYVLHKKIWKALGGE